MRVLARLRAAKDGSVAVMSSLAGACIIGCLALAVDVGSLHLERRRLQNVADLAAIAAANRLGDAQAAARAVLDANGVDASLAVETGFYTPSTLLAPAARYIPGGASRNAARVWLEAPGHLYFARVIYSGPLPLIRVSATAAEQNIAEFSIGSRLASLDGGLLNTFLGSVLGTSLNLSVMDYDNLASADLDVATFVEKLAGRLDITAGTYDSVLDGTVTLGDVVDAALSTSIEQSESGTASALGKVMLIPAGVRALLMDGRKLIDLGPIGGLSLGEVPSGLKPTISALALLRAAVMLAGAHQVEINLTALLPSVADFKAHVAIGEPEQSAIAVGPEGTMVYTAQTRIRLVLKSKPLAVAGLAGLVSLEVPLAVDLAAARAEVEQIGCGSDPAQDARVRLKATPAIGGFYLGSPANLEDWNSFADPEIGPHEVLKVAGIVSVKAKAGAVATDEAPTMLDFDTGDIAAGTVRTVSTSGALSTLVSSAMSHLNVTATLLGISLPGLATSIQNSVGAALAPLATAVQPVLNLLLDALGIGLGEADLRVYGVRCGTAALVM